nr:hypothetical protein CFP56_70651 [Quercus suber]
MIEQHLVPTKNEWLPESGGSETGRLRHKTSCSVVVLVWQGSPLQQFEICFVLVAKSQLGIMAETRKNHLQHAWRKVSKVSALRTAPAIMTCRLGLMSNRYRKVATRAEIEGLS